MTSLTPRLTRWHGALWLMPDIDAIEDRIKEKTYTPADLWALIVEVQRLRGVLGFYADPAAWEWQPDPSGGWSGRVAVTDGGARARAALARGAVEV